MLEIRLNENKRFISGLELILAWWGFVSLPLHCQINKHSVNQIGCTKMGSIYCFSRLFVQDFPARWFRIRRTIWCEANSVYSWGIRRRLRDVYKNIHKFLVVQSPRTAINLLNNELNTPYTTEHVYRLIGTLFIKCHAFFIEVSTLWQWIIDNRVLDGEKSICQSTVKHPFITHSSTWK